jgi:predicted metalloendopeptidase
VFFLAQTGYSLPERTYYLEDSAEMQGHRETLVRIASKFFGLVGYSKEEADKRANAILAYETKMAQITDDKEKSRNDHGTITSWDTVQRLMPYWPWDSWLTQLAACTAPPDGAAMVCDHDHAHLRQVGQPGGTKMYIMNEDFFPKMNKVLEETPLDTFKAVMAWQVLKDGAIFLSSEYIDLMVEFNKDLFGVAQKNPRERKCYYTATSITSWPVAKLYVDQIFHQENRAAALSMLDEVRARFMAALPTELWLTEEDRKAAENKLEKMFFQVAYTDAHRQTDTHTHTNTHTYIRIYVCTYVYIHIYMLYICIYIHTRYIAHISQYMHACSSRWRTRQTKQAIPSGLPRPSTWTGRWGPSSLSTTCCRSG